MNETKKLSTNCIKCSKSLLEKEMKFYLDLCERRGRDPLSATHGGILCSKCALTAILSMTDEEDLS